MPSFSAKFDGIIVIDNRLLEQSDAMLVISQYFPDIPIFNQEGKRQSFKANSTL